MALELQPIEWQEALTFIDRHHRHHAPPQGWKFGVAVHDGSKIVGVITVGRPVSRKIQESDMLTLEVTRCCTDGTYNACSILYAAAWKTTQGLGYKRLITYILKTETGSSLKAVGWKKTADTKAQTWNRESRPRIDKIKPQDKERWEIAIPSSNQRFTIKTEKQVGFMQNDIPLIY